jgi:hypothetical protein
VAACFCSARTPSSNGEPPPRGDAMTDMAWHDGIGLVGVLPVLTGFLLL